MPSNILPVTVGLILLFCKLVPVSCARQAGTSWVPPLDSTPHQSPLRLELPGVVLSETWDVLGPFRLGTRGQLAETEDRVG